MKDIKTILLVIFKWLKAAAKKVCADGLPRITAVFTIMLMVGVWINPGTVALATWVGCAVKEMREFTMEEWQKLTYDLMGLLLGYAFLCLYAI